MEKPTQLAHVSEHDENDKIPGIIPELIFLATLRIEN